MNTVRKLAAISLAIVLLFSMAAPLAIADTQVITTGSFNLGNSAPIVTELQIYSNSALTDVASSLTPQVQYWVKVTIADANTISDVASLKWQLFYDDTSGGDMVAPSAPGDPKTSVIINWTGAAGATLDPPYSTIDPMCTWSLGTPVSPSNLSASAGDWVFPITVGKVATQTLPVSVATGQWDLYAYAADSVAMHGESYTRDKAMYWYGEIGVADPTIAFGEVVAGSDFLDNVYEATGSYAICNGHFDVNVKSDANWVGSQGVQIAALDPTGDTVIPNQFALKMDPQLVYADAILVTSLPKVLMSAGNTGESGFVADSYGWWLKLSTAFTKETYSGAVTYTINN